MYLKWFILIVTLFISTSCDLLEKHIDIYYTKGDKLNMVVFLNRIPWNVSKYNIKYVTSHSTQVVKADILVNNSPVRIELKTSILMDYHYLLEVYKTDGTLCISRVICYLITNDYGGREMTKHKCLDQYRACHIQIDFNNLCDDSYPVIVKVDSPIRYAYLSLNGIENKTFNFYENETFSLGCHQNQTTNLTWHQHFPINQIVHYSEELLKKSVYILNIILRRFDDGTSVYCTGMDEVKSTRITFKLIETSTELKNGNNIYFNERNPIIHNCSKGFELVGRNSNGDFTLYGNKFVEIHSKSDNGSIFFCTHYTKIYITNRDPYVFRISREIDKEAMHIYMDDLKTGSDSGNLVAWLVPMIVVVAAVTAGVIAYVLYKRCPCKNRPMESQQNIYESVPDVVYAEINSLPCTSDKPNPTSDREPYAKIIGVLGPKK